MKQYKVTFWFRGQFMETVITANGYSKATELIRSMYPGAININLIELG